MMEVIQTKWLVTEELGSVTWQPVSVKLHTCALCRVKVLPVTSRKDRLGTAPTVMKRRLITESMVS